jgi:hypothetical protein
VLVLQSTASGGSRRILLDIHVFPVFQDFLSPPGRRHPIVKKHSLSTGASREAPVDKRARRLNA